MDEAEGDEGRGTGARCIVHDNGKRSSMRFYASLNMMEVKVDSSTGMTSYVDVDRDLRRSIGPLLIPY